MIEQLISRVAGAAGLDDATASKAVGLILGFLQKEAPEQAGAVIAQMPGAAELITEHSGGGGGLMGMMGGMMGGGIMGLGTQLMGAGLNMGQISAVGKEIFAYGRETAGEDAMGAIGGAIPGLSQFI